MQTGNLDSPAMISETYAVCWDSGELASAQTSITISGLNGDVDEEYELYCRFVSGAASSNFFLRPNNDSTAGIYGNQMLNGNNATATAARDTSETYIWLSNAVSASGSIVLSKTKIYAKSGYVRTVINESADNISGTTVTQINVFGQSHNDTSNNYTNMVVLSDQTNGIGIGSRIILMKKVTSTSGLKTGSLEVQGKVYGVWQKVYENTLTSAQTSITISGLDGNTDVMYRLTCRFINNNASSSGYGVRPNNDTGTNYGYQEINGANATVVADRSPAESRITIGWSLPQNNLSLSECLLYAKSGYIRTALVAFCDDITGTTVTRIMLLGNTWNNTADIITSLVVFAGQTSGLGIGTYLLLEKLVLS